jgi:hypothetical protein
VPSEAALFVHHLDLFVDYLSGKAVDRHIDPVMLLPFHDEVVLEALRKIERNGSPQILANT